MDPYTQLIGYVTENEPTHITSYKGARQLIVKLEMNRIREYVNAMEKSKEL